MIPWPMGRKLQWLELTLAGAKRYSHKERKKQVVLFSTHPSRLAQTFIHGFCHHPFCWAEPHFLWVHWSKKSASGAPMASGLGGAQSPCSHYESSKVGGWRPIFWLPFWNKRFFYILPSGKPIKNGGSFHSLKFETPNAEVPQLPIALDLGQRTARSRRGAGGRTGSSGSWFRFRRMGFSPLGSINDG